MRLSELGELALLEEIRRRFPSDGDVLIGIGDDTALIRTSKKLLLTTDTITEDVHFSLKLFTPYQIGYRLVASNVSDIYAMAGRPAFMLLNLSVPSSTEKEFIDDFLKAIDDASREYSLSVIGGDVTSAKNSMTFTATVIGIPSERVILRSGANPGDAIYLSGPTGEAMAGLELLKRIGYPIRIEDGELPDIDISGQHILRVLKRLLTPDINPLRKTETVTAMIDISDGLFMDLHRLCASSGVGAMIYEERIPISEALMEVVDFLGLDPYPLITSGGEDYVLLFTGPPGNKDCYQIGEILSGSDVKIVRQSGKVETVTPKGYEHFVYQR